MLDNAESILDPQGTNSREIYAMVNELCQFKTICLCVTSRITTVPRYCKRPQIPALSMEAACEIFYGIHGDGDRSNIIDDLLQRLDFHALSITLLATTASDNGWDHGRLAEEWEERRAQVLRTDYDESLAATIELSLNSPTFRKLGPNARDLLGVVAFFPSGVAEKNLEWVFPDVSDRKKIFDKFCVLSLTHRSDRFVTMLAPIRDYLCPQDPTSSPLLWATKDCYFTRLSVHLIPDQPGFREAQWIKSEDVNVEHLLDVLTAIYVDKPDVWNACIQFMEHLYWNKPRQTVLRPKVERLPNGHPYKLRCLFELSRLLYSVGNHTETKRLLTHALTLQREWGDDSWVALTLRYLSQANQMLGFDKEGIGQAEEALEMYKRFWDTMGQARCLHDLAWLLLGDGQLDAAEDAALRSIGFLPEMGEEYLLYRSHGVLGEIYRSKGERENAIHHFETALGIASPFSWGGELFSIRYSLGLLFYDEDKFEDANTHIERAKLDAVDNTYHLGVAMGMQAWILYCQCRLEEARSEVLGALEILEKLGAAQNVRGCKETLQMIERAMKTQSISDTAGEFTSYDANASHPH